MDTLPLFRSLAASKRILIAGAGGGFDVMSGLPLAFALRRMGKTVALANLTFSYVKQWLTAVDHVQALTPGRESIVCASIADAVRGHFGDHRSVPRIAGGTKPLFINPLMSLVWAFQLDAVARRCLYRDHVAHTRTMFEVAAAIEAFRKTARPRPRRALPM